MITRPGTLPLAVFPDDFQLQRECAGPTELDLDDQGNEYERCEENDTGHLYHRDIPYCLHCHMPRPEERG